MMMGVSLLVFAGYMDSTEIRCSLEQSRRDGTEPGINLRAQLDGCTRTTRGMDVAQTSACLPTCG